MSPAKSSGRRHNFLQDSDTDKTYFPSFPSSPSSFYLVSSCLSWWLLVTHAICPDAIPDIGWKSPCLWLSWSSPSLDKLTVLECENHFWCLDPSKRLWPKDQRLFSNNIPDVLFHLFSASPASVRSGLGLLFVGRVCSLFPPCTYQR